MASVNFSKFMTALKAVQTVAAKLGLPVPQAGITATDDETAQHLLALLNGAGRELIKPTSGGRWQALARTWTLTTIPGQTTYPLPVDWDSFTDSTGWNGTTMLPLLGPASAQTWSYLKARGVGTTTFSIVYRTRGNQFELFNAYSTPQTLSIDYASRCWLQIAGTSPVQYRDTIGADDDMIVYDAELIVAKLLLAFRAAKGFDTTSAQMAYNEMEEQALNADSDAPIISIAGGGGAPLLSVGNLPNTGYGH